MTSNKRMGLEEEIWVFGYGSLLWRPNFKYDSMVKGHVKGFVRRFYQGNTEHRGCKDRPGRVATLIPDNEGETYGCAYRLTPDTTKESLAYLNEREMKYGGYSRHLTHFYPEEAAEDSSSDSSEDFENFENENSSNSSDLESLSSSSSNSGSSSTSSNNRQTLKNNILVLLYVALPGNQFWLGETHSEIIAQEVLHAKGNCGTNRDYVIRLWKYQREEFPEVEDPHLDEIHNSLTQLISKS